MDAGVVVWAHLWNGGCTPALADAIKDTLFRSPPSNAKKRAELVAAYLWATDRGHPALRSADIVDFGRAIVELSVDSFDFDVGVRAPGPTSLPTAEQSDAGIHARRSPARCRPPAQGNHHLVCVAGHLFQDRRCE